MEESVDTLMDSTASKIEQLQKAFAELQSHRLLTLNLKWEQLEEHFNGLQKSLKRRFTQLEEQEKDFETKIVNSHEMLEKRKAAVLEKEQDSLERLQEKRDAAVSAILSAMGKQENQSPVDSGSVSCENQDEAPIVKENPHVDNVETSNIVSMQTTIYSTNVQVKIYPELVKLCQEMSADGLHKFISDNRKNLSVLKEEIPTALKAAANPASLVLQALDGFYNTGIQISDARKDSNTLGRQRTCIMLMECLSLLLMNLEADSVSGIMTKDVKEQAKGIAAEWKPKLDYLDIDASNGNSLEAHAFLQLLSTFGINSDFDQEILSKLIPMVSRRRQTAELCRHLGLSDKMPGVIDVLVTNGRHIDAVNLAFAFGLTDQFSPITILKSYLSDAKRDSPAGKSTASAGPAQADMGEKELAALKAVIKCIEDHKIEVQFPLGPLQKQVADIEKVKADKKRATEVAKPQSKRPRANGVGHPPAQRVANFTSDNNFYGRMTDRYVYAMPYAYHGPADHYNVPSYGSPATYNFSPGPGNFYGNPYQFQTSYCSNQ